MHELINFLAPFMLGVAVGMIAYKYRIKIKSVVSNEVEELKQKLDELEAKVEELAKKKL